LAEGLGNGMRWFFESFLSGGFGMVSKGTGEVIRMGKVVCECPGGGLLLISATLRKRRLRVLVCR
jgi:hypothetical protein